MRLVVDFVSEVEESVWDGLEERHEPPWEGSDGGRESILIGVSVPALDGRPTLGGGAGGGGPQRIR